MSDKSDQARIPLEKSNAEIEKTVVEQEKEEKISQIEWETDRRQVADARRNSLLKFLESSIGQRVELLRDNLAICITALIGAITLNFLDTNLVKAKSLFILAIAALFASVVVNLLARVAIIKHLQMTSYQIEDRHVRLFNASRDYLLGQSRTNLDTAYRIEYESQPFPVLSRNGDKGYEVAVWLLIIGVALLISSLFVVASFKI